MNCCDFLAASEAGREEGGRLAAGLQVLGGWLPFGYLMGGEGMQGWREDAPGKEEEKEEEEGRGRGESGFSFSTG